MSKKVFLSFSHKNLDFRNDLRSLFAEWDGPVQATPVYVTEDVRAQGDAAVRREIQSIMQGCRGLLLVIGPDVHNSEWIDFEIGLADSLGMQRAAVRHTRASGGLPNRFPRMLELEWDPAAIARTVLGW